MANKQLTTKQIQDLATKAAIAAVTATIKTQMSDAADKAVSKRLSFRSQLALANPKSGLEVATKDSSSGTGVYLSLTGGTMTGAVNLKGVGFNGTTSIAKPTVSGSRGGNAALQSLLSQLAAYGLIIDSTTT